MNIYALKGHKIRLKENFRESKASEYFINAKKYLKENKVYMVDHTRVGRSHSSVYLDGKPGLSFNTVHFIDVIRQHPEKDLEHPDYQKYYIYEGFLSDFRNLFLDKLEIFQIYVKFMRANRKWYYSGHRYSDNLRQYYKMLKINSALNFREEVRSLIENSSERSIFFNMMDHYLDKIK